MLLQLQRAHTSINFLDSPFVLRSLFYLLKEIANSLRVSSLYPREQPFAGTWPPLVIIFLVYGASRCAVSHYVPSRTLDKIPVYSAAAFEVNVAQLTPSAIGNYALLGVVYDLPSKFSLL